MRWAIVVAAAAVAATLWLPGEAAQPAAPAAQSAEAVTFEQYRDWRLNQIERRRDELARQLSAADLPNGQKARLEQIKSYYDWLAGLPEGERDRRFRERFERIDANHDGRIDATERAQWRDKQRALYHRGGERQTVAEPKAQ